MAFLSVCLSARTLSSHGEATVAHRGRGGLTDSLVERPLTAPRDSSLLRAVAGPGACQARDGAGGRQERGVCTHGHVRFRSATRDRARPALPYSVCTLNAKA